MSHESWMQHAINLAKKGLGGVNPNPLVGAVIVKDGRLIGEGYHATYGGPHAEPMALASCTEDPRDATIYVTLEPCCHHGKTPPCTEAILKSGITTVVIGSRDPNPKVDGGGITFLRDHGITVIENILRPACDTLNAVFFHYIQNKTPYIVMKYAMTADGKIATRTGASRWITGETARAHVHQTRNALSAILVGIGTVLTDDPILTCRLPEGGRNPVRIICDSALSIPTESKIVSTAREIPTFIAYNKAAPERVRALEDRGCQLLHLPAPDGRVDLQALMEHLHSLGIDSILAEGGGALNYSLLESSLVNRLQLYLAPKIFGGGTAKGPVGGRGVALPENAFTLGPPTVTPMGEDLLIEYNLQQEENICSPASSKKSAP